MEKLKNTKLRKTDGLSIFHDTRADVCLLMKVVNSISDKVNELVEENNRLTKEVNELKSQPEPTHH